MLVSKGCSREIVSGQAADMHEGQRHVGAEGTMSQEQGTTVQPLRRARGHASTGKTAMCPLWLKPTESVKSKKQRFL